MLRTWWIWLALSGCSYLDNLQPTLKTEHLDRVCQLASEVDVESLDLERRVGALMEQMDPELAQNMQQMFRMLAMLPVETRREAYRQILKEGGHPDFRCDPLERVIFAEVAVPAATPGGTAEAPDQ